jgi:hypothetical protein
MLQRRKESFYLSINADKRDVIAIFMYEIQTEVGPPTRNVCDTG